MNLLVSTAASPAACAPPERRAARGLFRLALLAAAGAGLLGSCAGAPTVKRDLSKVPAGQVGFDDLCGLQTYFDDIESRRESPPTLVNSTEFEGQKGGHAMRAGRSRFAFQGRSQVRQLRRVLEDNWSRMPDSVASAPRLDLEVFWSERDGLRRVASARGAVVIAGDDDVALPYHVCLSELLYGAPLYHQRREVMQLPALTPEVAAVEAGTVPGTPRGTPAPPQRVPVTTSAAPIPGVANEAADSR